MKRESRIAKQRGPEKPTVGKAILDLERQALSLGRTIAVLNHELDRIHADLAALRRE